VIEVRLDASIRLAAALSANKAAAAKNTKGRRDLRFSVARYGSVLGDRGSVIPFFLERRKTSALPITATATTRFYINIQDGFDMVLWSQ
jgi:FlaA1/EpsC-like NDP-sugar epimerase